MVNCFDLIILGKSIIILKKKSLQYPSVATSFQRPILQRSFTGHARFLSFNQNINIPTVSLASEANVNSSPSSHLAKTVTTVSGWGSLCRAFRVTKHKAVLLYLSVFCFVLFFVQQYPCRQTSRYLCTTAGFICFAPSLP